MIERIEWQKHSNELPSPFMRGTGERPLRLTLHSQGLMDLSNDDKAAMTLLGELSNLAELRFYSTSPGDYPYIVVDEPKLEDYYIPVRVKHRDSTLESALVWNKRQWPIIAAGLAGANKEDHEHMLNELVLAQAHRSVGGDIFVTKSPRLLSNRSKHPVGETNPRTPLEASRLTGLFLRSRNNYTHSATLKSRHEVSRGLFYWVLTRYHLPNMWRYFAACCAATKARDDDTEGLGEAILLRVVRALEALDAIGIQFYSSDDKDTFDHIVYHFDYLTLLLAGAIDAQARVANRAYRLRTQEQSASFRHEGFLAALEQNGAGELSRLFSGVRFKSLLILLYELRNTIHGAAPQTISYQDAHIPRATLTLALPSSISDKLLKAAGELGDIEEWGLTTKFREVLLEPYSYASALVAASLSAINDVAGYTDVARLFPNGQPVPTLIDRAPKGSVFDLGERFSIMA